MDLMALFTITSSVAGISMAICQVPQAIHVYKTKETDGISIWMQLLLTCGIAFWFFSGVILSCVDFRSGIPMWGSNGFCLIFCIYILGMCIINKNQKKK